METNLNKHCTTLEVDKILKAVAELAQTEDSKARIIAITPSNDEFDVQKALRETDSALQTIYRFGRPTITNIHNPSGSARRAEIGSMLTVKELLHIGEVLRVIKSLCQWKDKVSDDRSNGALDEYFNMLCQEQELMDDINLCIISEDEISDRASSTLADIRRKIRGAQAKAKQYLDNMIHSSSQEKFLQEQIITMRDGRYVVPVKSEYKGVIKGLVHDTSSSGATVFIEPLAVVEANNKVKILQGEEKNEIEKILYRLSAMVGECSFQIINSYDAITEIDTIFAKAKYAEINNCTMPEINTHGITELCQARHPLIDKKCCVPIDIHIGQEFDTLVITGPNTGGKTVSLKTLGLFCLMTMCGLLIPCKSQSKVSLYNKILVDIGDEQSIEQSLSTFSSHMKNIISILEQGDKNSLVLIDELGSGTDPVEGAALAVSILEKLRSKGCFVVSTTHYAEIKMYALETKGVENACCEFDINSLSPTYKLLIGVPGRSNAFAISQRLGLDPAIVASAKSRISAENTRFEDVVSSLEQSRQKVEAEREEILFLKEQTKKMTLDIEQKHEKIQAEKDSEIQKAREQAKAIVKKITNEAEQIIDELDMLRREKDNPDFSKMQLKAKQDLRGKLKNLDNQADPVKEGKSNYVLPRPLKSGDDVLICDINAKGYVLHEADNSGYVLVQAGIIKTKVKIDNLRLCEDNAMKKQIKSYITRTKAEKTAPASSEIKLIGMNVEEALMELDRFIDSCVCNHIDTIRIVHGKGSGILRNAVGMHLKKHRQIKDFRLGVYGEGENGVTIANIK